MARVPSLSTVQCIALAVTTFKIAVLTNVGEVADRASANRSVPSSISGLDRLRALEWSPLAVVYIA
jgi:hypothetical protein